MSSRASNRVVVRIEAELLDLVRAYLANRAKDVEVIKAALQRQDFETIRRIGHNMQGSGRTFGFEGLTAIGAGLQRAVAAANSAEIMRLQGCLADLVSRVEVKGVEVQNAHRLARPLEPVAVGRADGPNFHEQYVLVVDDQEMNRMIVSRYLEKEGYTVRQVSSGDEALAALEQRPPPAVILLDVVMSGLNGFEVCRRIKSNPRTLAIPVVLVTGYERHEDRVQGMEAGADGFLSKPVERQELLARVRALVRLNKTCGTLQEQQLSGTL